MVLVVDDKISLNESLFEEYNLVWNIHQSSKLISFDVLFYDKFY